MVGLMSEIVQQMDRLMTTAMRDENDSEQAPIYEWQFMDEMVNMYSDPLEHLEEASKK